jgi:hypothetical protein
LNTQAQMVPDKRRATNLRSAANSPCPLEAS